MKLVQSTGLKIYGFGNSIPEFEGMTKEESMQIWQHCWRKALRTWAVLVALLYVALMASFFSFIGSRTNIFAGIVAGGIGAGVGGFFYVQVLMEAARPIIRDYLAEEASKNAKTDSFEGAN